MKTTITLFLVLCFLSCKQNLPARHYKSTDDVTGGFNDFTLDLNSDGTLGLTISTSKATKENDAGTSWESLTKSITGRWSIKNEVINYSLHKSKSSIDSLFINTDFEEFKNKPLIVFSSKADTAYICGVPCLLGNK